MLWDSLSARLLLLDGKKVCVCGDFNIVRCMEERHSARVGYISIDFPFNQFIDDNVLIDLPMCGCKLKNHVVPKE